MATKLSQKEKSCNAETLEHIMMVNKYLNMMITEMLKRGQNHDKTKLDHPEVEHFAELTNQLAKQKYAENGEMTEETKQALEQLKPALDHHYAKNRHHPQHYPNGVSGMNLIDLVEMICDWKASSLRQHDGNILQSLEVAAKNFDISEELVQILKNTVEYFDMTH